MSVCRDQKTFDEALLEANKNRAEKRRPNSVALMIAIAIWIIMSIWALLLAMTSPFQKHKHTVLALVCPPVYIISYYIGK